MDHTAYVVASVRTPVGKAKRGSLREMRPEQLGAIAVKEAIRRTKGLLPNRVDDVLIGCAFPEGPQGMNVGRIIAGVAGLPDSVPGATVNRFCSSGLQTIAMACQAVAAGHAECIVAGGTESMSLVPMSGYYFQPDPALVTARPEVYVSMGNTAENLAECYEITRSDQDRFALQSHQRALAAQADSRFEEEIVPVELSQTHFVNGAVATREHTLTVDEGPRQDTSLDALAKLRPVFRRGGSVTAGNASQMSDGAAASVIMGGSMVEELGLEPMARLVGYAGGGRSPGGNGNWTCGGNRESSEAVWFIIGRYWSDRAQRSVCCAGTCGDPRGGAGRVHR